MAKCTHVVFILCCFFKAIFSQANGKPCGLTTCGTNANCQNNNNNFICTCPPNFKGDPYYGCQECIINEDCVYEKACDNYKCIDPCQTNNKMCGKNSECKTYNHKTSCTCLSGYNGDAENGCSRPPIKNPCESSRCGPKANCSVKNDAPHCDCPLNLHGDPWVACYRKCYYNDECNNDKVCINDECKDPCKGIQCGLNAECKAADHKARCVCLPGYSGDPNIRCTQLRDSRPTSQNLCNPSPCTGRATCHIVDGVAKCLCPQYPPITPGKHNNCFECLYDFHCNNFTACRDNKCINPCQAPQCGVGADCIVVNHKPECACYPRYDGDPYKLCYSIKDYISIPKKPCGSSFCGKYEVCQQINYQVSCVCINTVKGAPTKECFYECTYDKDCAINEVCISNECKAKDPCKDKCGVNTVCESSDHKAQCTCKSGYIWNPLTGCELQNSEDIFKNVSVHTIPQLKHLKQNIAVSGATILVDKLYEETYSINLTCLAINLPTSTTIMWEHYGKQGSVERSSQTQCENKHYCQITFNKDFLDEDNNTVVRYVVETKQFRKYILSILMIQKIPEQTSPVPEQTSHVSVLNDVTELPTSASPSTFSTNSETISAKQETFKPSISKQLIAGLAIGAILILIVTGLIIYWFIFRSKKIVKQDHEPIYAKPECHYAELSLPNSVNISVGAERVQYAEVVGVLKPKKEK